MPGEMVFEVSIIKSAALSEFGVLVNFIGHYQRTRYGADASKLLQIEHKLGEQFVIRDSMPRNGYVLIRSQSNGYDRRLTIQGIKQEVQPRQAYFPGAPDTATYAEKIARIIQAAPNPPDPNTQLLDAPLPKTIDDVRQMLRPQQPPAAPPATQPEEQPAEATIDSKMLPPSLDDELANIRNPKVKAMVKEYIQVVVINREFGESRETVAGRHTLDPSTITDNLPDKYKQKNKRRPKK